MAYVRDDITIGQEISKAYSVSVEDLEMQVFTIKKGENKKLTIFNVYRPPSGKVNIALEIITNKLTHFFQYYRTNEVIVLGDFNINYKFNTTGYGKKLKQTTSTLGLVHLIKGYTHYNPNGEPTIIDLIFTNSPHVKASGIITPGLSDHELVYLTREHTYVPPEKFTGRNYMHYDTDSFSMGIKKL